ncbi:MAG: SDR family NAD(P)-dependent oxidoreductase [Balneolaceae bacterium]|nr:SDR family NAD(P)-dependent oxidoreductase [Balneolaceae bacterium]
MFFNREGNDFHFVVTGGAGSLGRAVVRLLLDSGARCSVPCYSREELDRFELAEEEDVWCEAEVDLADESHTRDFFKNAVREHGDLWGSVHIAGGFGMGSIEDTHSEAFMKQIHLNTLTCYNSCRTAVEWMRKSEKKEGRIVNVAARPAKEPRQGAGMTAYTVSKAGVAALTESLAAELVEENILINAVAPSVIDTPANRKAMPDADYEKWPKPEESASQIVYLASPLNRVTRGSVVPVYGKS